MLSRQVPKGVSPGAAGVGRKIPRREELVWMACRETPARYEVCNRGRSSDSGGESVGHLLALSAVTTDLVGVVFSEKVGTKEIAQFSVFKSSKLIGKKLPELAQLAHVVGIVREGELIQNVFDPALSIREDDTLLVFGDPAGLHELEEEAEAL